MKIEKLITFGENGGDLHFKIPSKWLQKLLRKLAIEVSEEVENEKELYIEGRIEHLNEIVEYDKSFTYEIYKTADNEGVILESWEQYTFETIPVYRLRLLAINEEYYNCFEAISRNEFIKTFDKTPNEGYIESYEYWMNELKDENVKHEVEDMWDMKFIEDIFLNARSSNKDLEDIVIKKYQEIK